MAETRILNQAAYVVRETLGGTPADAVLRDTLSRGRHFSAPAERRAISRAVFAYFRWWRWLKPKDSIQKQVAAALDLQTRFARNPASVKPEALAALAVPDWLKEAMDPMPVDWLRQLQQEPPLWIRARRGREAEVAAALKACAPAVLPAPFGSPPSTALRYSGVADLFSTPAYRAGLFEIQDLASQLVGHVCAPQSDETWWDACAGEGGKSLHLSDLMQGKGLICVTDRSARRLATLRQRAARAHVFNYRAAGWNGSAHLPAKTKFDGILVDAPCSGVGTWRRNPHARWTTQPADVRELAEVQTRLLHHVAPALRPGGRLVYSVCTLTRAETTAVADAFTAAHPDFEPLPLTALGSSQPSLVLWPHELDANGMFIAAWRKK